MFNLTNRKIEEVEVKGVVLDSKENRKVTKQGDSHHAVIPAPWYKQLGLTKTINLDLIWDPKWGPSILIRKSREENVAE